MAVNDHVCVTLSRHPFQPRTVNWWTTASYKKLEKGTRAWFRRARHCQRPRIFSAGNGLKSKTDSCVRKIALQLWFVGHFSKIPETRSIDLVTLTGLLHFDTGSFLCYWISHTYILLHSVGIRPFRCPERLSATVITNLEVILSSALYHCIEDNVAPENLSCYLQSYNREAT